LDPSSSGEALHQQGASGPEDPFEARSETMTAEVM
jgi:hypothetical protein